MKTSATYKDLAQNPYFYKVLDVVKVVDGDTVDLVIDLGFRITMKLRVRMLDYDAPETYRPKCWLEKSVGEKVKLFLEHTLNKYKDYLHLATQPDPSLYGRWLGRIYALKGEDIICINDEVIKFMELNQYNKKLIRKKCEQMSQKERRR